MFAATPPLEALRLLLSDKRPGAVTVPTVGGVGSGRLSSSMYARRTCVRTSRTMCASRSPLRWRSPACAPSCAGA
eukprot:10396410-Alexandrium_andersonii.AAC.1